MLVEPCEIPFAGAPEILRREGIYAFPTMYAATTKGEGNDADGRFSATCEDLNPGAFPGPHVLLSLR